MSQAGTRVTEPASHGPSRHDKALLRLKTAVTALAAALGRQQGEVLRFRAVLAELNQAVTELGHTTGRYQASLSSAADPVGRLHQQAVGVARTMGPSADPPGRKYGS